MEHSISDVNQRISFNRLNIYEYHNVERNNKHSKNTKHIKSEILFSENKVLMKNGAEAMWNIYTLDGTKNANFKSLKVNDKVKCMWGTWKNRSFLRSLSIR